MGNSMEETGFEELGKRVKHVVEEMWNEDSGRFLFRESPEGACGERRLWEADCCLKTVAGNQEIYMRVFSMKELYEDWVSGVGADHILADVRLKLTRCREVEKKSLFGKLADYEKISAYLVIRPLNYARNVERLRDGLYERIGDVALVLYFDIGTVGVYYASSMVPFDMLKLWKREWKEVYQDAIANTARLYPVKYMKNCTGVLMSVKSGCNGAISIFLPGVAERMGQVLESDYYIAFTSVHELALHDSSQIAEESIREALKDMEEAYPAGDDFLTDQIFFYDRIRDRIFPGRSRVE